jgi:hypothetical protein
MRIWTIEQLGLLATNIFLTMAQNLQRNLHPTAMSCEYAAITLSLSLGRRYASPYFFTQNLETMKIKVFSLRYSSRIALEQSTLPVQKLPTRDISPTDISSSPLVA